MEREGLIVGNNSRAQTLAKIFNQAFDADARDRATINGLNDRDMFAGILAKLEAINLPYSLDDVTLALAKVEGVHARVLPSEKALKANERVVQLFDFFLENSESNQ